MLSINVRTASLALFSDDDEFQLRAERFSFVFVACSVLCVERRFFTQYVKCLLQFQFEIVACSVDDLNVVGIYLVCWEQASVRFDG